MDPFKQNLFENEIQEDKGEKGEKPHRLVINIGADNEKISASNLSNFSAREYIMSAGAKMSAKVKRVISEEDSIEIGKRTNLF